MSVVKKILRFGQRMLRSLTIVLKSVIYCARHGISRRFCPICGKSSLWFWAFGIPPREDARCPSCGSLERHRLFWLFVSRKTDLFDGKAKKMLHVAPEPCLTSRLQPILGLSYLTADLFDSTAMVKMDVTNISYPDRSFDVIYCSHVLEHVQDDRRAMLEFHRVLKDDGWAILTVPIKREATFEDPSIVEPEDRLRAFGQEDHVRVYGRDYVERLHSAGFHVVVTEANDLVNQDDLVRMGLSRSLGDKIYYCTKQSMVGQD